jgi:AcrR family transcriptional regulator
VPRAGLTPSIVVDRAGALADEGGLDRLTLAALAARLGVALPSLYKHVGGLDDLRRRMAIAAAAELADRLGAAVAGRSRLDALAALAEAYRGFAREHPGRYPLTQVAPAQGDDEHAAVAERAVTAVFAALRGYGLEGDEAVDATRALRSALHGFVLLESGGGFGLARPPAASFDRMIAGFDAAFAAWRAG